MKQTLHVKSSFGTQWQSSGVLKSSFLQLHERLIGVSTSVSNSTQSCQHQYDFLAAAKGQTLDLKRYVTVYQVALPQVWHHVCNVVCWAVEHCLDVVSAFWISSLRLISGTICEMPCQEGTHVGTSPEALALRLTWEAKDIGDMLMWTGRLIIDQLKLLFGQVKGPGHLGKPRTGWIDVILLNMQHWTSAPLITSLSEGLPSKLRVLI